MVQQQTKRSDSMIGPHEFTQRCVVLFAVGYLVRLSTLFHINLESSSIRLWKGCTIWAESFSKELIERPCIILSLTHVFPPKFKKFGESKRLGQIGLFHYQ